jgi:hypothetical protein
MRDVEQPRWTPRVARFAGRARPAAAAILAFTLGLLVAACGSGSSTTNSEFLSTKQTKGAIEESILAQRHIHATVVCPTEVVREKGVTFQCVATTPTGAKTVFRVVEANGKGYVEYSSAPKTPEKKQTPEKAATRRKNGHKKS